MAFSSLFPICCPCFSAYFKKRIFHVLDYCCTCTSFFSASRRSIGQRKAAWTWDVDWSGRQCLRHSGYGLHTAGIFDMACIGAWCVWTHECCFFRHGNDLPLNLTSSLFFFFFFFLFFCVFTQRAGVVEDSLFAGIPLVLPRSLFWLLFRASVCLAFDHGSRAVFVATPACVESRDWHRPSASRSVYHQHPRERNEHGRHGPKKVRRSYCYLACGISQHIQTNWHGLRCKREYTQCGAAFPTNHFNPLCVCTAALITRRRNQIPDGFDITWRKRRKLLHTYHIRGTARIYKLG